MKPMLQHSLGIFVAMAFLLPTGLAAAKTQPLPDAIENVRAAMAVARKSPINGLTDRLVEDVFRNDPPGPGWKDAGWADTGGPDLRGALRLLEAAQALGIDKRKDRRARKVLWEIAGRLDHAAHVAAQRPARVRAYLGRQEQLPQTQLMLDELTSIISLGCDALHKASAAVRAFVLAQGPPPRGRPLLAEQFEAYRRLGKDIKLLAEQAQALAERYGTQIEYDWPGRLADIQGRAESLADILALVMSVNLTRYSSKDTLDFIYHFTDNFGFETWDINRSCAFFPDGDEVMFPPEKYFQQQAIKPLERFHRNLFNPFVLNINNRAWHLRGER